MAGEVSEHKNHELFVLEVHLGFLVQPKRVVEYLTCFSYLTCLIQLESWWKLQSIDLN